MKILVSAYACEPNKGSEPGVGWNTVYELSKYAELWVITRRNNKENIEKSKHMLSDNVHFVYYDLPKYLSFWKKGRRGVQLYYYLWQIFIYFIASKLTKKEKFDLIHHVTFVKYWTPSFLVFLPIPFIWGPVGGGESSPKRFWWTLGFKGFLYEIFRVLARRVSEFDPFLRMTARKSKLILATTEETAVRVRQMGAENVKVFSQVGLTNEELEDLINTNEKEDNKLRIVSMGNLLPFKGYHLVLQSLQFVTNKDIEYWIIGDGQDRTKLERLAKKLRLNSKIKFFGKLPRNEALEQLKKCDIFIHPSLHESGGNVCAEAAGANLPVICLDLGGPGLQVTSETGYKIKALNLDQVTNDIANLINDLDSNRPLLKKLGNAGRSRVSSNFNWLYKGKELLKIYEESLKK